jgi:hypothetical protein
MNADHIDAVAREIRKYYLERKNSAFSSKFKLRGNNAEFVHWQKAALLCLELNATPEVFVDAAFANCKNNLGPFPNAMYGQACRKWYTDYTASRVKFKQTVRDAEAQGKDVMFGDEAANEHVYNLKYDIELTTRSLIRLTGESEINATTIEYINSLTTNYPAHIRVLLGFGNEKVKLFFGEEALNFYNSRPHMYRAAEILGYPIKNILIWLHAQKN